MVRKLMSKFFGRFKRASPTETALDRLRRKAVPQPAGPEKDPAEEILGDQAGLATPLEAPVETSAEVEQARRRELIKAGLRSGRLSTILKDKSY